ncbi:MAG: hypothetical protein ACWGON_09040, partial [Gemmatimonadota bacterium]
TWPRPWMIMRGDPLLSTAGKSVRHARARGTRRGAGNRQKTVDKADSLYIPSIRKEIRMVEADSSKGRSPKGAAKAGIGFGTALAIAISWSANKSILWAIVHGLLSWLYVIYYAIKYQ